MMTPTDKNDGLWLFAPKPLDNVAWSSLPAGEGLPVFGPVVWEKCLCVEVQRLTDWQRQQLRKAARKAKVNMKGNRLWTAHQENPKRVESSRLVDACADFPAAFVRRIRRIGNAKPPLPRGTRVPNDWRPEKHVMAWDLNTVDFRGGKGDHIAVIHPRSPRRHRYATFPGLLCVTTDKDELVRLASEYRPTVLASRNRRLATKLRGILKHLTVVDWGTNKHPKQAAIVAPPQ